MLLLEGIQHIYQELLMCKPELGIVGNTKRRHSFPFKELIAEKEA